MPGGETQRPWVVLAGDVLVDTRNARDAVVRRLAAITDAEIAVFRAMGGYDDPWELTRAASAWVRAGRPLPLPDGGWRALLNEHGGDPGDLREKCERLLFGPLKHLVVPAVDAARLTTLAELAEVGACHDPANGPGLEALLGFRFSAHVPSSADALRALAPKGHLVGGDDAVGKAAGWTVHPIKPGVARVIDGLVARFRMGKT